MSRAPRDLSVLQEDAVEHGEDDMLLCFGDSPFAALGATVAGAVRRGFLGGWVGWLPSAWFTVLLLGALKRRERRSSWGGTAQERTHPARLYDPSHAP